MYDTHCVDGDGGGGATANDGTLWRPHGLKVAVARAGCATPSHFVAADGDRPDMCSGDGDWGAGGGGLWGRGLLTENIITHLCLLIRSK